MRDDRNMYWLPVKSGYVWPYCRERYVKNSKQRSADHRGLYISSRVLAIWLKRLCHVKLWFGLLISKCWNFLILKMYQDVFQISPSVQIGNSYRVLTLNIMYNHTWISSHDPGYPRYSVIGNVKNVRCQNVRQNNNDRRCSVHWNLNIPRTAFVWLC